MGRTNGRLIPFLKEALEKNLYNNLAYDDDDKVVFSIRLPRAGTDINSDIACEKILKDWYKVNRNPKYINYSSGKTVFQAALKKSIYLITLPRNGTRKRFRYSTPEEAEEKKELQKRRSTASENSPPSVCSSGYHSGSDDFYVAEGSLELGDTPSEQGSERATSETGYHSSEDSDVSESSMELDAVIPNQMSNTALDFDDDFDDIVSIGNENSPAWNELLNDLLEVMENDEPNGEIMSNNKGNLCMDQNSGFSDVALVKDETESLKKLTVPVQQNLNLGQRKIWVCKKDIVLESVVILICESVMIESNDVEFQEQIFIPNCKMFEPGKQYILQKRFVLQEKLFMFFI